MSATKTVRVKSTLTNKQSGPSEPETASLRALAQHITRYLSNHFPDPAADHP